MISRDDDEERDFTWMNSSLRSPSEGIYVTVCVSDGVCASVFHHQRRFANIASPLIHGIHIQLMSRTLFDSKQQSPSQITCTNNMSVLPTANNQRQQLRLHEEFASLQLTALFYPLSCLLFVTSCNNGLQNPRSGTNLCRLWNHKSIVRLSRLIASFSAVLSLLLLRPDVHVGKGWKNGVDDDAGFILDWKNVGLTGIFWRW